MSTLKHAAQVLVEQLRQKCLQERVDKGGEAPRGYSALTQSPREWALEPGKPCGGERLLLMFDRWCDWTPDVAVMLIDLKR